MTPPPQSAGSPLQPLEARLDRQRSERSAQALQPPGTGKPLPPAIQAKMEQALGHGFSDVRVHEGPQAESIGALAYTRGTDLHFAPGRYSPMSHEGQKILGHELAHVVQQKAGRVAVPGGAGAPINADESLEAEADALGGQAARSSITDPAAVGVESTSQGREGRSMTPTGVAIQGNGLRRRKPAPEPPRETGYHRPGRPYMATRDAPTAHGPRAWASTAFMLATGTVDPLALTNAGKETKAHLDRAKAEEKNGEHRNALLSTLQAGISSGQSLTATPVGHLLSHPLWHGIAGNLPDPSGDAAWYSGHAGKDRLQSLKRKVHRD